MGEHIRIRDRAARRRRIRCSWVRGRVIRAYRGERKHVLLVDDDPVNRQLLRGLLLDLGFLVGVAEDGALACAP